MGLLRKLTVALGAFFVLAIAITGCGGVPGDSVAIVDGNPITKKAFDHWMFIEAKGQASQSPGSPVIVPDPPDYKNCIAAARTLPQLASAPAKTLKTDCSQVFKQYLTTVMSFLIRSYWYQADAASHGIKITDAQVQKAFNTAKNQQFPTAAGFQTFLTQSGQTLQDLLFRVRVNQLYMKLIAKQNATITPKAIQAYYNSHASQFGTPKTLNLRLILTKTKAQALAAQAALNGGATFKATAAKFSIDASTKNNGGQLTGVTPNSGDTALTAAAFAAPLQKLQGPIKGQFGFYVFKVTSVKTATTQTLAQATPTIKQILTQQKQTSAQSAVDARAKKAYFKKTQCRTLYATADCSNYKAPKTTTSTTPTVPTPAPSGTSTSGPAATVTTPTTTTKK
jgi:foldase protein PrsA